MVYYQCYPHLKTRVQRANNDEAVQSAYIFLQIITLIKGICCQFYDNTQEVFDIL